MKEPQQYEVTPTGMKLTQEWKDWREQTSPKKKRGSVGRLEPIDPETHKETWKEIAWVSGSEKRILFCCCRSQTGMPFSGCGAVGIRHTRAGKIDVVVEPRFE